MKLKLKKYAKDGISWKSQQPTKKENLSPEILMTN